MRKQLVCKKRGCHNLVNGTRYCNTCRSKASRKRNKLKYCYQTLKDNAKRRDKFFDLTFEQFEYFCNKTNYHKLKGITPEALSIDRKNPYLGYTIDNIRAITLSNNVKLARGTITDPEWQKEVKCPF